MALLSFILGILGNITALLGLVSPMPTFWRIMKKGSTGSFSAQPYLFSLMAGLFWTYYGVLKRGGIFVVTISATSSAFQLFYLGVYFWFGTTAQQRKTAGILLLIFVACAVMIVSTQLGEHGEQPLVTVGILCTVTSVFSTAAPLTIIHKVVKTRSVEYMPFYLSLGIFLNNACWLSYALSLKDMFITIPNAIGMSLAAIQLALYGVYRSYGTKRALQAVTDEELTKAAGKAGGGGETKHVAIDIPVPTAAAAAAAGVAAAAAPPPPPPNHSHSIHTSAAAVDRANNNHSIILQMAAEEISMTGK